MAEEPEEPAIILYKRPVDGEFPDPSVVNAPPRKWPDKACEHKTPVVDKDARTVECKACGVALDPIQCLVNIATWNEKVDARIKVIREYEAQCREVAARTKEEHKTSALARAPTLRPGDKINVWYQPEEKGLGGPSSIFNLYVSRVTDDAIEASQWGSRHEYVIAIKSLTQLRVLKRARY